MIKKSKMTELKRTVVDDKLDSFNDEDKATATMALETPDLYPAKTLSEDLGVMISKVWEWRRMRGIYKSDC